jgi:hypothetical protein
MDPNVFFNGLCSGCSVESIVYVKERGFVQTGGQAEPVQG